MLRKFAILTIILAQVVYLQAQELKFGVHIDPGISLFNSDYTKASPDGVNFSFGLGLEGEYRLGDNGNVAVTFGAGISFNNGGSITYGYSGQFFRQSQFDNARSFVTPSDSFSTNSIGIDMLANTKINYRVTYVQIPIGLKLRTDELGGSYMRAFFHIPVVKIMIPVIASAKIFTPGSEGGDMDINPNKYGVKASENFVVEQNVWKDITPIQLSVGIGAGIEFAPTDPEGLKLYAGLYYDAGIIDVTGGFLPKQDFTELQTSSSPNNLEVQSRNPWHSLHNISLRIGCIF